jgi:histidine ammonia-lyase
LAVELLGACQGIDFRAPLKTTVGLQQAHSQLRAEVAFYDKDRYFSPDIERAQALIQRGDYNALVPADLLPSLQS